MFKHSALLLVDLQNDFCPGGALAVTDGDSVIPVANRLIDFYQQHHGLIVASQDWHPSQHGSFADNQGMPPFSQGELNGLPQTWWPAHCIQKSQGADFHPKLNRTAIQEIIQKGCDPQVDSYSAFFDNGHRHETGLQSLLKARGITHLTILGLATDYCVKFTTLDALELGFTVTLVTDGCRGVNIDPQDSQRTLENLQKRGATLLSSAALLANPTAKA